MGQVAVEDGAAGWDERLADDLYDRTSRAHRAIDGFIELGRYGGALVLVLAVAGLLAKKRRTIAALLAAAVLGVLVLDLLLKKAFADLGPGFNGDDAFEPSGHSMASMAALAAATLLAGATRYRGLAVAVGAILVFSYGVALVARNWHYPSEVIAGWCVAVAWVGLLRWATAARDGPPSVATGPALPAEPRELEHAGGGPRNERRLDARA